MGRCNDDWGFGSLFEEIGSFGRWMGTWQADHHGPKAGRGRRRQQLFEAGEVKFLMLELLREKPRHGYEIIKALEERMGGHYTPSPGTVYPTLQLLEDQGHIRAIEAEGRKVYELTASGLQFLDENRGTVDDILARVKGTMRDRASGPAADFGVAMGRLVREAGADFRRAWQRGDSAEVARIVSILERAMADLAAKPAPAR